MRPAHRRRARCRCARMAEQADVLIVGLAPGRADEWGLDDESLRAANPGLVYCSITGFGPTGPYARLKAYEGVVQAKIGAYSRGMFGFRDGPVFAGAPTASTGAAHMARERDPRGADRPRDHRPRTARRHVARAGHDPGRLLRHLPRATRRARPPREPAAARTPRRATAWRRAATRSASARRTAAGSTSRRNSRTRRTRSCASARSRGDARGRALLARAVLRAPPRTRRNGRTCCGNVPVADVGRAPPQFLAENDLPFELCGTSEEALDHPQIIANGEVVEVDDPVLGTVREVGPVATFAESPSVINRSRSALGVGSADVSLGARTPPPQRCRAPEHALSGVTIVEFGYYYAMPYGVALAAALGARVIKLEGADGDPMRHAFGGDAGSAKVMEGKESLSVDMKSPEGREIVHRAHRARRRVRARVPARRRRAVGHRLRDAVEDQPEAGLRARGRIRRGRARTATARCTRARRSRSPETCRATPGSGWTPSCRPTSASSSCKSVIAPRSARARSTATRTRRRPRAPRSCSGSSISGAPASASSSSTSMIGGNVYSYSDDAVTYDGKPPLAHLRPRAARAQCAVPPLPDR